MKITKKYLYRSGILMAVLAVASLPVVVSAAQDTSDTTINATVAETITITATPTVALGLAPASSAATSVGSITTSVNTNKANGYQLRIANGDATTSLVSGSYTIPAHTGTIAAPTALANNSWGFAVAGTPFDTTYGVANNGSEGAKKFAGIPANASPITIKTTSSPATNDSTTVFIGAKVSNTQPTGSYTDTITFTAVTN